MRKTYTLKGRRGITDLKSMLPEQGTEWWSEEQWKDWNKSLPARRVWDAEYINLLKAEGRYGEEFETKLELEHNPELDEPNIIKGDTPLESYKIEFIDFADEVAKKMHENVEEIGKRLKPQEEGGKQ